MVTNILKVELWWLFQNSVKSPKHFHMLGNVIELFLTSIFQFLHPQKFMKFIHVNNGLKIYRSETELNRRSKIKSNVITPKRHIYTPFAFMKTQQTLSKIYRSETELIIRHQLKTIIASKSRSKIRSKVINRKRHIYTPEGMCVCNMKTIRLTVSEVSSGK